MYLRRLRMRDTGQALIYLMITIAVLSIIAVAGGAAYYNLSTVVKNDEFLDQSRDISVALNMVFKDEALCSTLFSQPAPSLPSEFNNLLSNPSYTVSPDLTLELPNAVPAQVFIGPGTQSEGALTVQSVTLKNIQLINQTSHSYRVDVQINFAETAGRYSPPALSVPFYVVNSPNKCFSTYYVAQGETKEDLTCKYLNGSSAYFDPGPEACD